MKKVFRIILPILLVLAIVLALIWYLFVYDRAFTRDILLSCARSADLNNKPAIAAWFYDLAYNQSVDSDEVAIELAMQHKADGNYTQAEVILSKAIEDGGSTDLYIALSRTYVEQDKLLDAVKLLNGITNPAILEDMKTLRPAAPTATPEPGFYNQYVPVVITAESGNLFVNANGEYPSYLDKPCTEPVVLHDGENTIFAVAVAENGLVSPLTILGYTVGGIIEEVSFADPAVEAAVREVLGVKSDVTLMSNQLWTITSFKMPIDAKSYADLKYMPFLTELTITCGPSGQLSNLSHLSNLTVLDITDTTVNDEELEIIGTLSLLKELTLNGCSLSTAEPIGNLTSLTYLNLGNNTIRNIQPLRNLTGLTEAYLQHNALTDLTSLSGLSSLTRLDVSYNALTTLSPICTIQKLTWLDANHNVLNEVTQLGNLTGLEYLSLAYNELADISSLASCTALTELQLSNNYLTEINAVAALVDLVKLNFSNNGVTELPAFEIDCSLITIDGSYNYLESLDPLSGLLSLNNIYMDYNEDLESIEPLEQCPVLVVVNVYGTAVTSVKSITDMGVVVNFDPTQSDSLL